MKASEKFWIYIHENPIHENVMKYIRYTGFAGVLMCDSRMVDNALFALVERWRPETNTFHMPFGEVTVTLQDIEVLWGLKVDGPEVCGTDKKVSDETIRGEFYGLTGILLEDIAVKC